MAIEREIDRTSDGHAHRGIQFGRARGRNNFGGHAELTGARGDVGFGVERVLGFAQHEQPAADEAEVVLGGVGELCVERAAREREIADERRGARDVVGVGGAHEAQAPRDEVGAEARPDIERALGIEHPFERQLRHAGRGERDKMTRDDHARVAEGAAVSVFG